LASTRHPVTWLGGKAPRSDASAYSTGVWRLESETDDAPDPIAVFVDDRKVGRLGGLKMMAYAPLLDELGAPIVVSGPRTGDRLWVDLPNLADFREYIHTQTAGQARLMWSKSITA
jgi:non-ribosomal peptide synthetase component E (peptide arylation enzyme)